MLKIQDNALIDLQVERILESKLVGGLVLVIPDTELNDTLSNHLNSKGYTVFRGASENVLKRFYEASKIHKSELIIRLTADCPLIMPDLIDKMLLYFEKTNPQYLSNKLPPSFPDGLDVEIFESKILNNLMTYDLSEQEEEHVTLGIYRRPDKFRIINYLNTQDLSRYRWTVDYFEDYEFVAKVYNYLWEKKRTFKIDDILHYINLNPAENNNELGSKFRDISLND